MNRQAITDHLLDLARRYASQEGIALSAVSRRCAKESNFLPSMAAGGGYTIDRWEAARVWLEEHMKDGG